MPVSSSGGREQPLKGPGGSFAPVHGRPEAFQSNSPALSEAHRVLRPRGKLTYNHEGPRETDPSRVFWKTFSKHKGKNPSRTLRKKREAMALQSKMIGDYTDPFAVLSKMRRIGFRNSEASIASLTLTFGSIEEYMDYQLAGSLEYAEMNREKRGKFGRDCSTALKKLLTGNDLIDSGDVVFFSVYK